MKWNLALGNAFGNSHDWKSVNYFHIASYVIW